MVHRDDQRYGKRKRTELHARARGATTQPSRWQNLLAQLVAAGEFNGTLTSYMHNFDTLKAAGAPVEWAALAPSFANSSVGTSANRTIRREEFIESCFAQKGQEVVARAQRIQYAPLLA